MVSILIYDVYIYIYDIYLIYSEFIQVCTDVNGWTVTSVWNSVGTKDDDQSYFQLDRASPLFTASCTAALVPERDGFLLSQSVDHPLERPAYIWQGTHWGWFQTVKQEINGKHARCRQNWPLSEGVGQMSSVLVGNTVATQFSNVYTRISGNAVIQCQGFDWEHSLAMKVKRLWGPASLRRLHQLAFSKQCGLPLTAWRPVKEAVSGGTVVAVCKASHTTSGSDLLKNSGADGFDIAAQGLGAWYCTTQTSPKHPIKETKHRGCSVLKHRACSFGLQTALQPPWMTNFLSSPLHSFTSSLWTLQLHVLFKNSCVGHVIQGFLQWARKTSNPKN